MDEMDRLFRQSDFSAENEGLGTRIWNQLIRRKEEPVIMPIHKNEITEEMMMQAMQCKDADELIALAKTGGYEITKEEAETYMAELEDFELEDERAGKTVRNRTAIEEPLRTGRGRPEIPFTYCHLLTYIRESTNSRGSLTSAIVIFLRAFSPTTSPGV